jgi:hypothetical protein
MNIINFPVLLMGFSVDQDVPKGVEAACAHVVAGRQIIITTPIALKPNDLMMIDPRSGKLEIIERGGIVIWRAACVN